MPHFSFKKLPRYDYKNLKTKIILNQEGQMRALNKQDILSREIKEPTKYHQGGEERPENFMVIH